MSRKILNLLNSLNASLERWLACIGLGALVFGPAMLVMLVQGLLFSEPQVWRPASMILGFFVGVLFAGALLSLFEKRLEKFAIKK